MKTPVEIGNKFKERITTRYPALDKSEIPENYTATPIEYKKEAIEEYHVIFWHRLLRNLYNMPIEMECEIQEKSSQGRTDVQTVILRNIHENNWEVIDIDEITASGIQAGKAKPFPINWKYLVRLPSGGIVELATRDKNTVFYIALIILPERDTKIDRREADTFINLLVDEASRQKYQLFNPTKEFERQEGLGLYLLFNVYLSNYLSAKTMLATAETLETELWQEFLRYDARAADFHDEEKRRHINQYMLTCGMYYCSTISYFLMALEGFINLVFHAFLKKGLRDKDFRLDQRFDLEQKLRLMFILCDGFNENSEVPTAVLSGFKRLKNYRNSLFHSKVEDSLKGLCFVEDGFLYTINTDEYKDHFLPAHKIGIGVNDVIRVKKLVDDIVNCILESMNQDAKNTTETYIMKEPQIPIFILETGELAIGKSGQ